MEYRKTKKIYIGMVVVDDDKVSNITLCMGLTKEQTRYMVKKNVLKALKAGNTIRWNKDEESEVTMFKDVEYDDYYPEMSEYVTKYTMTVTKGKATRHHVKRMKNPMYNDHLEDKEKTPVNVCTNCRKTLKVEHEFMTKELTA